MPKNEKILLAKVLSEFGIKGQVKIVVYSDEPLNLEKYNLIDQDGNEVFVRYTNKNKTPIKYQNGNPIMIATINGSTTRNNAESQRKLGIYILRKNLKETQENEYYYSDLMNMDVVNQENNEVIGTVNNVFDHGAGTILSVEFSQKAIKPLYLKEEYFAFKDEIFPKVDVENNQITINLPDFAEVKSEGSPDKEKPTQESNS